MALRLVLEWDVALVAVLDSLKAKDSVLEFALEWESHSVLDEDHGADLEFLHLLSDTPQRMVR